ncbi:hypothetical protein BU24DRAFT_122152 [Aaosphaeria arxii CBS 175.79]|uniref:Uncharacterized protein n=1 Tax=Aaosphaeria arxii CBS 175.79 TaxID=1450172 RepID=A0A6A5Y1W8_9PLEO|nr:uncharacterized protein BU24DRAFT_122152 [Aaosphaeria arxii CBS 175.79]KAF2019565.1 hypothetical protein BU24DRAFT_122152 [Aaosphaeria arxii CBS 175.79]
MKLIIRFLRSSHHSQPLDSINGPDPSTPLHSTAHCPLPSDSTHTTPYTISHYTTPIMQTLTMHCTILCLSSLLVFTTLCKFLFFFINFPSAAAIVARARRSTACNSEPLFPSHLAPPQRQQPPIHRHRGNCNR